MATLSHHFLTMAYNNTWANHRLLGACARLSQAEFVAPRTSFFPSIKATLNHIVTVDWLYVDMLERSTRGLPPNPGARRFFEPEEPFDTCGELAAAQIAVDRRLIDLCAGLTEDQMDGPVQVPRQVATYTDRVSRILAHLFQHQIHHRGQAHAMLAGTRVAPPQLDEFFCSDDAHLRAADLAELGVTEEVIWGRAPSRR